MRIEAKHPEVGRVLSGRFAEGPEYATWRTAGTDDFLLIHTVSGVGRFGAAGGELVVEAGDSVLLAPGVRHDYGTHPGVGRWEIAFAHFHPRAEWTPLLDWPRRFDVLGHLHPAPDVHDRVVAALERAARSTPLARAELFAVNALEEALLWLDSQNPLATRTDARVIRVAEHIGSHLAEELDVGSLAAVVHLSPSRLTRLFTEQLGLSPQRYVERERMLAAQQLLDLTDRSIASIAAGLGWDDPLYFSQRFRRFSGSSPSEYRRAGRG